MIKYNLKIAWRNFLKDRQFTWLNVIGLATGLACTILIYLWVMDERQVDKFNVNDDRLYQVMAHIDLVDGIHTQESCPAPLAAALTKEFPVVAYSVSVQPGYSTGILSLADKHIKGVPLFVDKDFFHVFSYSLIQGSGDQAFSNKYAVVLSEELALKLFNTTKNIVGKAVRWDDDKEPYIISGVFKKPPVNASVQFDLLFSFELFFENHKESLQNWGNAGPNTYLVVKKGTDISQLRGKLKNYLKSKPDNSPLNLSLRKYSDSYLYGKYENGEVAGGRIQYVRLFSIIAVFILVIACINFMNLSTAKAAGRLKEVGIKKVAGARRISLVFQYLIESTMMSFFSTAVAVLLVTILLPQFNVLTGKQLTLSASRDVIVPIVSIALITGLIAGSYPAFYLSGFKPVAVLKKKFLSSAGEDWLRKGLVVFQFTLSLVLIVSVLIIYRQMKLVQTINLGYNKDNIITFKNEGKLNEHYQSFIADVKNTPSVISASSLYGNLNGNASGNTENVDWKGKAPGQKMFFIDLDVDYGLLDMLDIKMAEGRTFSRDFPSDELSIILNEAAVKAMGLKDPINQTFGVWGAKYKIIGIAKDFHFESLYTKVRPCFIRCIPGAGDILVKIKAGKESTTIAAIDKLYRQYNLGLPLEYTFMDKQYQAMYASEQRVTVLSRYFAGLAIIISCLGLFGLAAFTAQKRQKEISIRKVLGATVNNLAFMLSKDFLKLVIVAILIASPLAWWGMNQWLNSFAYRVKIGMDAFIISGASLLLITLLTISFQSIKAAIANPANSLRSE